MHWCTGGKVDEKKAAGNKALATNCFFNISHFTRQLARDAKHGTAYQLHTCSQCKEKVRENIGTHLQCTEELGRSVQNVLQLQCPLHSAYLQSTLQCYSASSQFAKDTQYQYTMHCAQLQCRVLNERIQYISRLVQDLKCTMCRIGQCIAEQNRANTVEQPASVHSSLLFSNNKNSAAKKFNSKKIQQRKIFSSKKIQQQKKSAAKSGEYCRAACYCAFLTAGASFSEEEKNTFLSLQNRNGLLSKKDLQYF